ncbi:hypothetical protein SH661x_000609 [Planctomicrobium sp. SH661]|uniref:hypothetical protein n=1 Tax=Planctomicrobium sp. SH661 TaxID=3448124 RepID=UPI003F5BE499
MSIVEHLSVEIVHPSGHGAAHQSGLSARQQKYRPDSKPVMNLFSAATCQLLFM